MSDHPPDSSAAPAGQADDGTARRGTSRVTGTLLAERDRWPLWTPVCLGIGIALYFALPREPLLGVGPLLCVIAAAVAWVARGSGDLFRLGLLAALTVATGFAWVQIRTQLVAAPTIDREHGPAWVHGRLLEVEPRAEGPRLTIAVDRIEGVDGQMTPERVRISYRPKGLEPWPGMSVRVLSVLMPPPEPAAPGAFDFARVLYFRSIGAVGYAVSPIETDEETVAGAGVRLSERLSELRLLTAERIVGAISQFDGEERAADETAQVAVALLTGLRSGIPEDVLDAIRIAGLAHLLAISGLHLGLVAGIAFFVIRSGLALSEYLALRYPIKKWAAALAVAVAFGYLLLTGVTIPTQRAFIMASLVLFAVIIDREAISLRAVAWAAVLVLLMRPESLLGASFQMSFAAVVALVAFYEAFSRRAAFRSRPARGWRAPWVYLYAVLITTAVASLATAPFAAFHFNRLAVYGLAANLVAVPTTALWIMPWGLLGLFLMPFGLESLALVPMGWGIDLVIAVARVCADLPGAVYLMDAWPTATLSVIVLGGLWLALWRRRWRYWGILPILIGPLLAHMTPKPDVLVDDTGRLFAVRAPNGTLSLSTSRRNRFDADIWLRRNGQAEAWPWVERSPESWPEGRLRCDNLGCVYRSDDGVTAALVQDPRALHEDCALSDVVISAVPVRIPCRHADLVIDRFDLWRNGAHALWLDRDHVRAESVHGRRGLRPWVADRSPRTQ